MLKWTGKLAVLSLAISLWASPLVACMFPDAVLSPEERECCADMANQCGQMEMPSSHSCCKLTVREIDAYLVNSRFTANHSHPVAASPISSSDIFLLSNLTGTESSTQTHAPPVSPPATISILKI
jgi:hypothetical protein